MQTHVGSNPRAQSGRFEKPSYAMAALMMGPVASRHPSFSVSCSRWRTVAPSWKFWLTRYGRPITFVQLCSGEHFAPKAPVPVARPAATSNGGWISVWNPGTWK